MGRACDRAVHAASVRAVRPHEITPHARRALVIINTETPLAANLRPSCPVTPSGPTDGYDAAFDAESSPATTIAHSHVALAGGHRRRRRDRRRGDASR